MGLGGIKVTSFLWSLVFLIGTMGRTIIPGTRSCYHYYLGAAFYFKKRDETCISSGTKSSDEGSDESTMKLHSRSHLVTVCLWMIRLQKA